MTGGHEPSDQNLLKTIAEKEHELQAKVSQAKVDARRVVDEGQRRADAERERARREAADLATRAQQAMAQDAETLAAERLAAAQAEAQRVRVRASERTRQAIDLVITRVLDGLETQSLEREAVGRPSRPSVTPDSHDR